MTLNAPQIIYLFLVILGLGICLERHGKPKTGEYNFFVDLFSAVLAFGLLYWGNFFG